MSWPTCDSHTEIFGQDLRCVLPKHHSQDGQLMHENIEGCQWLITLTDDDGNETYL